MVLKPLEIPLAARPDLPSWVKQNLEMVRSRIHQDGGIWLRGSYTHDPNLPRELVELVGAAPTMEEVFWSTPRAIVGEKTYTATEYPPHLSISLHSETSYFNRYPRLICFHSLVCAKDGGETPIADLDQVSRSLDPVLERFSSRGIRYSRFFHEGIDIPLSVAFGTTDHDAIALKAEEAGLSFARLPHAVALTWSAQAALTDSQTGLPVWFNQVHLSHPAALAEPTRTSLLQLLGPEQMPRQACYGDGTPIPGHVVHTVNSAFDEHAQLITWAPGDVLLLDNLRFAHGRRPFRGPRRIHVAVGRTESGTERRPFLGS